MYLNLNVTKPRRIDLVQACFFSQISTPRPGFRGQNDLEMVTYSTIGSWGNRFTVLINEWILAHLLVTSVVQSCSRSLVGPQIMGGVSLEPKPQYMYYSRIRLNENNGSDDLRYMPSLSSPLFSSLNRTMSLG